MGEAIWRYRWTKLFAMGTEMQKQRATALKLGWFYDSRSSVFALGTMNEWYHRPCKWDWAAAWWAMLLLLGKVQRRERILLPSQAWICAHTSSVTSLWTCAPSILNPQVREWCCLIRVDFLPYPLSFPSSFLSSVCLSVLTSILPSWVVRDH